LLLTEMPTVVERIEAGGFDITFDVPNRDATSRLTRPTLNLFLYHVQENRALRPAPWETGRLNGGFQDRRPPVRVECSYLVTAWSNEVEDEHRLLTGAARVFFRHLQLPIEAFDGEIPEGYEIPMMVAQPGAIKDIVDIWSVLDNDLRPSIRVTVTIPLELDVRREGPLILERQIRIPPPVQLSPDRPVDVTGRIVRAGEPVAGVQVRMDRSAATTREDGTFELRGVRRGTTAALVAVNGDILRIASERPAGDFADGSVLTLDLDAAEDDEVPAGSESAAERDE
jgi:hypothetical protein